MRNLYSVAGLVIASLSVVYFMVKVSLSIPEITLLSLQFVDLLLLIVVVMAYMVVICSGGYAWLRLLRAQGELCSVGQVFRIFFISQPAKYLPGNIGHYLSRFALARTYSLDGFKVLRSMGLETAVLLLSGLLCSLVSACYIDWNVLTAGARLHFPEFPVSPSVGFLIGLIFLGGMTLIFCLRDKRFRRQEVAAVGVCALLYVCNFLLLGGMVYWVALWVFEVPGGGMLLTAGVFALAWTAGFVVPGAPAGFGIREVIFVVGLTPVWGEANAVGIGLVFRFLTLIGDGLAFMVGFFLQRRAEVVREL